MRRLPCQILSVLIALPAWGQNNDPLPVASPVIAWDFDETKPGTPVGNATLKNSTLISPEYPDFPKKNTSLHLNASSSWKLPDQKPLRFTNGDSITIESWVYLDSLSNGTVGTWLNRLSDDHELTQLALQDLAPSQLLEQLFLRLLTRRPTTTEKKLYLSQITPGYESRLTSFSPSAPEKKTRLSQYVSWNNHLDPVARRSSPPAPVIHQPKNSPPPGVNNSKTSSGPSSTPPK